MLDRIHASIAKKPKIGVVGIASWDSVLAVENYPGPGGYALVSAIRELPGGTSANAAASAAALGAQVELLSTVGDDAVGRQLTNALAVAGVDTTQIRIAPGEQTDRTTVITSADPPNRTIFWHQGAIPRLGDRFEIDRLFTRDLVLIDSIDPALRRFLIDLPVHTYPDVKILVPLTYAVDFPGRDELESLVRCDALVGSETELCELTGADSLPDAIRVMQRRMSVSNLRNVAVTRGPSGAMAFDATTVFSVSALSVEVVDTTGAGDTFAGAFAFALACRIDLPDALALANCAAGLSIHAIGAQTALPSIQDIDEALSSPRFQVLS